ncbi:LssY C-terminal domain-containing protein [Pseudarthrobacter sp. S9]|uniref:LssY C-terminal domain-containing protein n=1 Tax=Pseudarthrobacter sp. S9 TaxID=3418421 RepID=UPI003CFD984E
MISVPTRRYGAALLAVVVLTALNAYLLNTLDVVGIPLIFAAALLVQLLLIILFVFSLIMVLRTPLKIAWSILVSAWEGVRGNTYVVRFRRRYPRLVRWSGRRFSMKQPTGLVLTVGAAAAATALLLFISITRAVILKTSFAGIDQRILNLVPDIRTDGQNTFFSVVAFAASSGSVIFFLIILGLASWRRRQWWVPVLLAAAFGLERASSTVIKQVVARPRPDRSLGLLTENSFSFPSGHTLTATVIGGLAAYLLCRSLKSSIGRLMIVLAALTAVLLVGVSRIYLGVHYPSDILGSLALGFFLLAGIITPLEINDRFHLVKSVKLSTAVKRPLLIAAAAALLFAGIFADQLTTLTVVEHQEASEVLPALNEAAIRRLPIYSETLTGARMEPINFIYLGSQQQIEGLFKRAGWYKADPSTLGNTLRSILVAVRNEQYLTAPVTPSYLDARPETVAFEQPTDANTLVQRHHTRIWKTNFTIGGQPVWVATASFDRGIGIGTKSGLPTHHIDPNIDAERAYILQSLHAAQPRLVHVADAQLGHNATGDGFFTDGQAAVLNPENLNQ